jgi:DNA-binding PadR family transcriptional regulator
MSSTQAFDDGWARPAWMGEAGFSALAAELKGRRARRESRGGHDHSGRPAHHERHDQPGPHEGHPHHEVLTEDGTAGRGRGRRFRSPEFGRGGSGGPGGFGGGGPFGFGGPFGPFGPGGGRGRGGARARRGDVRAAALVLLAEEPRNGYQLIQELANRSDGAWRASPGSVYPALQQLEDEGLIQATTSDNRKQWELTDAGRAYVAENKDKLGAPWEAVGGGVPEGVRDLGEIAVQVAAAVHQVHRAGNDAQIVQAAKILTDTRRALYRLLAGDDEPTS